MVKRTNASADSRFDTIFDDPLIAIEARDSMAASHLSGADIRAMYSDDVLAWQRGESFTEWANDYWGRIGYEAVSMEVALEVFDRVPSVDGVMPLADLMIIKSLEQVDSIVAAPARVVINSSATFT